MVYVDDLFPPGPAGELYEMFADELDELHALAAKASIPRTSFYATVVPHYRITEKDHEKVLRLGAADGRRLDQFLAAEDCRVWWRKLQGQKIRDRRKKPC